MPLKISNFSFLNSATSNHGNPPRIRSALKPGFFLIPTPHDTFIFHPPSKLPCKLLSFHRVYNIQFDVRISVPAIFLKVCKHINTLTLFKTIMRCPEKYSANPLLSELHLHMRLVLPDTAQLPNQNVFEQKDRLRIALTERLKF